MKSERCYEITGLKFPRREGTIDDFESYRQPIRGCERSGRIQTLPRERPVSYRKQSRVRSSANGDVRSPACGIAFAEMHSVVVHVGPNQSLKFEHTPQGFVGITNLAACGSVSLSFANCLSLRFNRVCCVEVEARALRGGTVDHLAHLIRGQFPAPRFLRRFAHSLGGLSAIPSSEPRVVGE
jgi:hypothetical protein